jgi:hypothetical protein
LCYIIRLIVGAPEGKLRVHGERKPQDVIRDVDLAWLSGR